MMRPPRPSDPHRPQYVALATLVILASMTVAFLVAGLVPLGLGSAGAGLVAVLVLSRLAARRDRAAARREKQGKKDQHHSGTIE